MSLTKFSGRVYPDKSFSIGVVPSPKKQKADSVYDREWVNQPLANYSNIADWLVEARSLGGEYCNLSEAPHLKDKTLKLRELSPYDKYVLERMDDCPGSDYSSLYDVEPPSEEAAKPLLVKSLKSSQKKRGSYGKHGITNYGRRFCKNACILLEQRYGIRRLGFATATLPSMDRDTCRRINGKISDITRRFYQKIRRIFEKRGQQFKYVGVVEIQEKRFGKSGLPVPHLHFVYVAKASVHSGYIITTKECYTAWNESVNEVLCKLGGAKIMGAGRHKGSVKLEPIRSSASAYLGKYLSKGCGVVKAMQAKGFEEFPKQWWTASMQVKEMFKKSVIHIKQDICAMLFYDAEELLENNFIAWMQSIWLTFNEREYRCGMTGTLSEQAYVFVRETCV